MKTYHSILLIVLFSSAMRSQPIKKVMAKEHDVTLGLKRSIKEESKPVFQIFYSKVFRPSVSVDLLESSGIHLFTITNIHPLPSFSVGARFKAGLVITI